jgi:DNA-directed RNA polymerase specialized sigma24 family protein
MTTTPNRLPIPQLPDQRTWLSELAKCSLGDFELTTEIDADLSLRAIAARADPAERDALFTLLAMKIDRFSARFRRWSLFPWEQADVTQETYLVFVALLDSWRPLEGNGGPAGFGYYFVQVFPRRLADRINALVETRKRHGAAVPLPWVPEADERPAPGEMEDDAETAAMIAAICGRLNAADAVVFRLSAHTELERGNIASFAGISRRTLYRRWPEIVSIAREELAG